jgi:cytochrome c556
MSIRSCSAAALAIAGLVSCGPPKNYTPVAEIPGIKTLSELMDAQATAADPQFGKAEQASFTDAEYTELAAAGAKLDATSKHIKDFTKGADFDALAAKLNGNANALSTAAAGKDAAGARAALTAMKATCKECHAKYR